MEDGPHTHAHTLRTIGSGADTRHTATGRITGSGDCWTHRSRRAATTPKDGTTAGDVRKENSPRRGLSRIAGGRGVIADTGYGVGGAHEPGAWRVEMRQTQTDSAIA